jgi:hypothetical protein
MAGGRNMVFGRRESVRVERTVALAGGTGYSGQFSGRTGDRIALRGRVFVNLDG